MKNLFIVLFICSINLIAIAAPTPESLFRNGDNKEIKSNNLIIQFSITKKGEKEDDNVLFYKSIYDFKLNSLVLIQFTDQSYREVMYVNHIRNLDISFNNLSSYRDILLFSSFKMLFENSSKYFSLMLTKEAPEYLPNTKLINLEKKGLMSRHATFLQLKNQDDAPVDLKSPFYSEDPEIQKQLIELKKAPMYKETTHVNLIRNNKILFWNLNFTGISAYFFHENHKLNKLTLSKLDNDFKIVLDNYIIFDGSHELPQFFQLYTNDKVENIKFKSIRYLDLTKSLSTIYKNLIDKKPERVNKSLSF